MSALPSVTLGILAYNEEGNLGAALEDTLAFATVALTDFEIVVVDDGSRDGTAAIAASYAAKDNRIRLVQHPVNRGMGAGIRSVIEHAQKQYFVFNAADGQIPAAEIGKLLPLLGHADVALSTYGNRRETWRRELMSRAFRLYLTAVAGIRFELQGLYLYPTRAAKAIAPLIEANTFFFSFELIQRGIERGLTIASTEMLCQPRRAGHSKVVSPRRIVRVSRDALRYGAKKWLRLGAAAVPVRRDPGHP